MQLRLFKTQELVGTKKIATRVRTCHLRIHWNPKLDCPEFGVDVCMTDYFLVRMCGFFHWYSFTYILTGMESIKQIPEQGEPQTHNKTGQSTVSRSSMAIVANDLAELEMAELNTLDEL